jgi:hypothetical protein
VFTLKTEYHPAGDEHLQARTGRQELRYRRPCFQQPLEVVQYEEQSPITQILLQHFSRALFRLLPDPERLSDGRWYKGWVADGGERNEAHTFRELVEDMPCYFEAQPSLADAAGARKCQETYIRTQELLPHFLYFLVSTNERSERRGKAGGLSDMSSGADKGLTCCLLEMDTV